MTEPGGVGTPGTDAAWEALIADLDALAADPRSRRYTVAFYRPHIEAEATRAERERIVRAVEGLRQEGPETQGYPGDSDSDAWVGVQAIDETVDAILAILRDTP